MSVCETEMVVALWTALSWLAVMCGFWLAVPSRDEADWQGISDARILILTLSLIATLVGAPSANIRLQKAFRYRQQQARGEVCVDPGADGVGP